MFLHIWTHIIQCLSLNLYMDVCFLLQLADRLRHTEGQFSEGGVSAAGPEPDWLRQLRARHQSLQVICCLFSFHFTYADVLQRTLCLWRIESGAFSSVFLLHMSSTVGGSLAPTGFRWGGVQQADAECNALILLQRSCVFVYITSRCRLLSSQSILTSSLGLRRYLFSFFNFWVCHVNK